MIKNLIKVSKDDGTKSVIDREEALKIAGGTYNDPEKMIGLLEDGKITELGTTFAVIEIQEIMEVQDVLDYRVIASSRDSKKVFDNFLQSGALRIIGTFKNEFGELFVIFKQKGLLESSYFITGDELSWEIGNMCDFAGNVYEPFLISPTEREQVKEILFRSQNG